MYLFVYVYPENTKYIGWQNEKVQWLWKYEYSKVLNNQIFYKIPIEVYKRLKVVIINFDLFTLILKSRKYQADNLLIVLKAISVVYLKFFFIS